MKTNKPTKREIVATLRTLDSTKIFAIAKRYGVEINDYYGGVYRFIKDFAPTQKISKLAYSLSYEAKGNRNKCFRPGYNDILRAVQYAKIQKDSKDTSYFKILIEGNKNIYWASLSHGHRDYNKLIAFAKTPKNLEIMSKINAFLLK